MSTPRKGVFPDFLSDRDKREWAGGFLLVGMLLGGIGSLLVIWDIHLDLDPRIAGLHFLALNAGYVSAAVIAQRLVRYRSLRVLSLAACAVAFSALAGLALTVPPISFVLRLLTLGAFGLAGGLLTPALLHAMEASYNRIPAAAANITGAFFGCGCLFANLLLGLAQLATNTRVSTGLLSAAPAVFFIVYLRNRYPPADAPLASLASLSADTILNQRDYIAASLFSLLLFFQFGNEWAIAGWLPLFLIHRLGSNPTSAIFALALYFFALLLGRVLAQVILPTINHRKLLVGSVVTAMVGYLLLSVTDSLLGAVASIVVIGTGFAPIYPLVVERLGGRLGYHPKFYNGVFSIAITGAMLAPWLLGYVAAYFGIQFVMLFPAIGSIIVFVLVILIMFEGHLMGDGRISHLREQS